LSGVTFQKNAENSFCVLRAKALGHRDLVTIVGHAATIPAGEWITASMDQRSYARPAVQGAVSEDFSVDIDRRHREVSRFRHDFVQ